MKPITKEDMRFNPRVKITQEVKNLIIKAIDYRLEHDLVSSQPTCYLCEKYDPEYNNSGCINCPLGPASLSMDKQSDFTKSICGSYEITQDEDLDESNPEAIKFLNILKEVVLAKEDIT